MEDLEDTDRYKFKIGIFVDWLAIILVLIGTTLGFAQEQASYGRPDRIRQTVLLKDGHKNFTGGFLIVLILFRRSPAGA